MMNITAKPTWQWLIKNTQIHTRSLSTETGNMGVAALKNALMPRSLAVEFSLKYRR